MVASPNDMLDKFEMPFSLTMESSSDTRLRKKALKPEDPMSHRIIEKRRRDRMNNCLADLSRLIPAEYLKKGRGRIEKTEIIEMAIKHMRHLQTVIATSLPPTIVDEDKKAKDAGRLPVMAEHYRLGYLECLSEAMHFLVEIQGFFAGDALCVQLLNHLHRHCDRLMQGNTLNFPRQHGGETTSNSSNSTGDHEGTSPPLGMSNSTGGHSDEQTDFGTYSSECDEPQLNRKYSSSSGVGSFIKEETEGDGGLYSLGKKTAQSSPATGGSTASGSQTSHMSQLRDMLTSSNRKAAEPLPSDDQHMYKFKNNIQQRYNEEEEATPCKKIKLEEPSPSSANKFSFGHKTHGKSAPPASPGPSPSGIPIFALHANGAFYIPLTMEQNSLTPFMSSLTAKPPHKTALHPVTISVNFQQQRQSLNDRCQQ